jgi:Ca2+-binding RTX toxin-like protein
MPSEVPTQFGIYVGLPGYSVGLGYNTEYGPTLSFATQASVGYAMSAEYNVGFSMEHGWESWSGMHHGIGTPTGMPGPSVTFMQSLTGPALFGSVGAGVGEIGELGVYMEGLPDFTTAAQQNVNNLRGQEAARAAGLSFFARCFSAETEILVPGQPGSKPIANIAIGDTVLAFDGGAVHGRGALVAKQVVRLFRNVTDTFIELSFPDGRAPLHVTPGHEFLSPLGGFRQIGELLRAGGGTARVVLAGGEVQTLSGRWLRYGADTARLFEEGERIEWGTAGGLALAPEAIRGWQTFNFEVEDLHTYVAGGVRVHNDSWADGVGFEWGERSPAGAVVAAGSKQNIAVDPVAYADHQAGLSSGYRDSAAGKAESAAYGAASAGGSFTATLAATFSEFEANGGDNVSARGVASAYSSAERGYEAANSTDGGTSSGKPLIIDLDGDGVEIVPAGASSAAFDFDDDGYGEISAWASADDGFLVFDEGADGDITLARELSLALWTDDDPSDTDLEAVAEVFDSNHDGLISSADTLWSSFKVWQDSDRDGNVDSGEMKTLASLGIVSFSLTSDGQAVLLPDSTMVHGQFNVNLSGGVTRKGADVSVAYAENGYTIADGAGGLTGFTVGFEAGGQQKHYQNLGTSGQYVDLASAGLHGAFGNVGNDNFDAEASTIAVTLSGEAGNDCLEGGSGNDLIIGGDGADTLLGASGLDTIIADDADVDFQGGAGEDTLYYSGVSDLLLALAAKGFEHVYSGTGHDELWGGSAANQLVGGSGNDDLYGEGGNDTLFGGAGADYLHGGDGNDTLYAEVLDTGYYGGAGDDILFFESGSGLEYSLTQGGFEHIVVDGGDNTIWGNSANNRIVTGDGVDFLQSFGGNDTLMGGAGADEMLGGDGNDTLFVDAADTWYSGDAGVDSLVYLSASSLEYHIDTNGFENVSTSIGDDTIWGGTANNLIYLNAGDDDAFGGAGADTLHGHNGTDQLCGDGGDDTLHGGAGADVLNGGTGIDTASYTRAATGVTVHMGWVAQNLGDALGDTYTSIENLEGSAHDDTLIATDGNNVIKGGGRDDSITALLGNDTVEGGGGDDELYGNGGTDTLKGNSGADSLFGDSGIDRLEGGSGDDFALGGTGNDVFAFTAGLGSDLIGDFNTDGDIIELSGLGVSSFQTLQSYMSEWNGDTHIDFDAANCIVLESVAMSSLQSADFRFL